MNARMLVLVTVVLGRAARAEEDAGAPEPEAVPETKAASAPAVPPVGPCVNAQRDPFFGDLTTPNDYGLPDGPASVGYFEADLATGRRACPRTEFGVGARFGAIIDRPNFYGNLAVNGLLFGSWALSPRTEVFATLEAVNYAYVVNATIEKTNITLGNLTAGVTRVLFDQGRFVGSASARVLLPTSFEIPGARLVGAEVSHLTSWGPRSWLEVHSAIGVDVTAGLSAAAAYPRFGATALVGVALKPASWFALVVDANGHVGARNYLAPSAALRFRVASLGIELGGTLPVVGTDRHDFIMGGRFSWRW